MSSRTSQSAYGYYADMSMQDATSALFTENSTLEILGRGVFLGSDRIYEYMRRLGAPTDGRLFTHMQLQPVINGLRRTATRANIRARLFEMFGMNNQQAQWAEGTYENRFVLDNGVWKYQGLNGYQTFYTDYEQGWGKHSGAADELLPGLPARHAAFDRIRALSGRVRAALPLPQSGERQMSTRAGLPALLLAGAALLGRTARRLRAHATAAGTMLLLPHRWQQRLAELEARTQRIEDINAIKRLQRAYGYYLDEGQWDDVADLFADDASLEIGLDGVYRGRDRIREYFRALGDGTQGPGARAAERTPAADAGDHAAARRTAARKAPGER